MGARTGIEWTDSTWSPIRVRVKQDAAEIARAKGYTSLVPIAEKMAGRVGPHCEHVSPGCANCYAETNNHRCLPANGTGLPYDRRSRDLVEAFVDEKALLLPLKWKAAFDEVRDPDGALLDMLQRPRRIFVENQSDLFGEWVTDEMLDRMFAVMATTPHHTYQVLTKRPERMRAYLERDRSDYWFSVALDLTPSQPMGFSDDCVSPLPNVWLGVSNEGNQHQRIDLLREVPAAKRFISFEPLLFHPGAVDLRGIDWAICGGESGPGARPMRLGWARSLRDQCQVAGVPFFFKQWGQWVPTTDPKVAKERGVSLDDCMTFVPRKKAAGALLDGCEWKQFPEAR